MFNCTIFTDAGAFEVNVAKDTMQDGKVVETALDAWEYVKEIIDLRRPFVGSDAVISFEAAQIKAIVVKAADLQQQVTVEQAEGPAALVGFSNFGAEIDYLGNKLQVHGLSHAGDDGYIRLMPMMVNGMTPYEALDGDKLEGLLTGWAVNIGLETFEVVMPPEGLDAADALDYLTDYMKEVEGVTVEEGGDAQAWPGWKGSK